MIPYVYQDQLTKDFLNHITRLEREPRYREAFRAQVCAIPYERWLECPKWKMTRTLKLLQCRACESCGTPHHLEIHHKTYDYLGVEVLNLDSLAVLCDRCHHRQHSAQLRLAFFHRPTRCLPYRRQ